MRPIGVSYSVDYHYTHSIEFLFRTRTTPTTTRFYISRLRMSHTHSLSLSRRFPVVVQHVRTQREEDDDDGDKFFDCRSTSLSLRSGRSFSIIHPHKQDTIFVAGVQQLKLPLASIIFSGRDRSRPKSVRNPQNPNASRVSCQRRSGHFYDNILHAPVAPPPPPPPLPPPGPSSPPPPPPLLGVFVPRNKASCDPAVVDATASELISKADAAAFARTPNRAEYVDADAISALPFVRSSLLHATSISLSTTVGEVEAYKQQHAKLID